MDVGASGGGRMEGGGREVGSEGMPQMHPSAPHMFQRNTSVIVSVTGEERGNFIM